MIFYVVEKNRPILLADARRDTMFFEHVQKYHLHALAYRVAGIDFDFKTQRRFLAVDLLVKNGLLEYIEGKKKYKTTVKGRQYLKSYEYLNKISGKMTAGK